MDLEKIGKFIAELRKAKNITQQELAEKLGVTDRTVGNWENGRNMPDLSLFKPLCQELNISLNDLMSGEIIQEKDYQEKFEENVTNTLVYSNKKITKYSQIISLILIVFGLFVSFTAIMIFPSESSWGSIYSILGIIIIMIGIFRMMNTIALFKKIILIGLSFMVMISVLLCADYLNVLFNQEAPMFRIRTTAVGDVLYYDALFYDVFRCHFDKENEYWVIEENKKRSIEELINYCE